MEQYHNHSIIIILSMENHYLINRASTSSSYRWNIIIILSCSSIILPMDQYHPTNGLSSFYWWRIVIIIFICKNALKRIINNDIMRTIDILHQLILLLWHQRKRTLKIISQIWDTSFICFTSNPMELTLNVQGEQSSVNTVKDTISPIELHFMLMSFISVFVESIRKDEFSKTNHRCIRHQKGCSTTWNFFLAANCDLVQRGVSNS